MTASLVDTTVTITFYPLEQGLRLTTGRIINADVSITFYPLEQGLRLVGDCPRTILGNDYLLSTRTRIKTDNHCEKDF